MSLPYFYIDHLDVSQKEIILDEETSAHIVQVLRMKQGESLQLTDGRGKLAKGHITEAHKKHCSVLIGENSYQARARVTSTGARTRTSPG